MKKSPEPPCGHIAIVAPRSKIPEFHPSELPYKKFKLGYSGNCDPGGFISTFSSIL